MDGVLPVDVHESRPRASEIKFLVDPDRGGRIRDWLRRHLPPDPHGTGPHGDEYATSTLYFDTPALDVLTRRGSYGRAKYRIRRYGASDRVFLERKLRRSRMLAKRRTLVPVSALERLAAPRQDGDWEGAWFERRVRVRGLAPACQVTYVRTARMAAADTGIVRVTVDTNLRVAAVSGPAFVDAPGRPSLDGYEIVEMKFRDALPPVCARLVHEFGLLPTTASKYRLGMAALGHATALGDRVALTAPGSHA